MKDETIWFGKWATLNKDVELDPRFLEDMKRDDPYGFEAWQMIYKSMRQVAAMSDEEKNKIRGYDDREKGSRVKQVDKDV